MFSILRLHFLKSIDRILSYIRMTIMMSSGSHKDLKLVCQGMVEIFANFVAYVLNKIRIFWVRIFTETVISISRNGLLKSCARFVIERSEIRKKQHDFKSVHFECRMVLFYMIWEKKRIFEASKSILRKVIKEIFCLERK